MNNHDNNYDTAGAGKHIVILLPSLAGGGAERLHLNMAPTLVSAGFKVTLLFNQIEGSLRDQIPQNIRVKTLGSSRSISSIKSLVHFLRDEKPDILLSNLGHTNIVAIWAVALARTHTRVIATQHNSLSGETSNRKLLDWRYRILPLLYRIFLKKADAVVAVSEGVADDLSKISKLPRHKITTIYNPVILDDFDQRMSEAIDHPWLHTSSPPVFLGVGRFILQKDFATLINAFALLKKRTDARLILLGEGPLKHELESLIAYHGLTDYVSLPGFQANPFPFMLRSRALIMASRYEGFGNVLVEALSCGTPVISTDCLYGPAEILNYGKFGKLVPVGDPNSMANAMLGVLEDPSIDKESLRAHGKTFNVTRAGIQYIHLFNKLLTEESTSSQST